MARATLKELQNRWKEKEAKKANQNQNKTGFSRDIYPFWTIEFNEEAVIRLLLDKNEDNPENFTIEKHMHKLSINGKNQKIPCLNMYGDDCPICERSRKYYKAEGKGSPKGLYYWARPTHLVRALIIKDPLPADPEHGSYEGKICTLDLGQDLYQRIMSEMSSPEMEDDPYDIERGCNFYIRKTKGKGGYAEYVGSGFARRSSAIPKELAETIVLTDLTTHLPKHPTLEKVLAQLQAHDNGAEYSESSKSTAAGEAEQSTGSVDQDDQDDSDATVSTPVTPVKESAAQPSAVKEPVQASDDGDEEDELLKRILKKK